MRLYEFCLLSLLCSIVLCDHFGVYRGAAPYSPPRVVEYEDWLQRKVYFGLDFEASDTWVNVAGPGWILSPWSSWANASPDRNFIISVPMLPTGEGTVSVEKGANGTYNPYFRTLAQNLVSKNLSGVYIRLGWEFDGNWYGWRAGANKTAWPIFWRQIVTTMRNVAGQNFKFVLNGDVGYVETNVEDVYPGNAYVDVIAVDIYDQSYDKTNCPTYNFGFPQKGKWKPTANYTANNTVEHQHQLWRAKEFNIGVTPVEGSTWTLIATYAQQNASRVKNWNALLNGYRGLKFWANYSRSVGKPFAIGEWGVWNKGDGHGGGDNPLFIQGMYDFITNPQNNVLFQCYFDVFALDGDHQLSNVNTTNFPDSSALFERLFRGSSVATSFTSSTQRVTQSFTQDSSSQDLTQSSSGTTSDLDPSSSSFLHPFLFLSLLAYYLLL